MIGVFNEAEVGGDRQPAEAFSRSALVPHPGFCSRSHLLMKSSNVRALKPGRAQRFELKVALGLCAERVQQERPHAHVTASTGPLSSRFHFLFSSSVLMLARRGFDLSGCVGRTGSRCWTPAGGAGGGGNNSGQGRGRGGAARWHKLVPAPQLNWGMFTAGNANFPSLSGHQMLPPSPEDPL